MLCVGECVAELLELISGENENVFKWYKKTYVECPGATLMFPVEYDVHKI